MIAAHEIAVIGAGASGCFCAANLAEMIEESPHSPKQARITIYEAGSRPLAKVSVTGGGRCNLTNSFRDVSVEKAYPRGAILMKRLLRGFSNADTCRWFEAHGVGLVTQEDQCVFPRSQNAMSVVNTLLGCLQQGGVGIKTCHAVKRIEPAGKKYALVFNDDSQVSADIVAVSVGGLSSQHMQELFLELETEIVKPVPALFTIKTDSPITELSGTVVSNVSVGLQGTRLSASGPILVTDWGFSGPAVLKLSSYAARVLAASGYKGVLSINWIEGWSEKAVRDWIDATVASVPERSVSSVYPDILTSRLWKFILNKSSIKESIKFAQLTARQKGRLCSTLFHDCYSITGRARFKEEFVTCGGISLGEIDPATLESRRHPGLYFTGEVLDIDAITGGFNLQAAWTTGYTAAQSICKKLNGYG